MLHSKAQHVIARFGKKPFKVKKYFVRDMRLGGQTVLHSDDFFTQERFVCCPLQIANCQKEIVGNHDDDDDDVRCRRHGSRCHGSPLLDVDVPVVSTLSHCARCN